MAVILLRHTRPAVAEGVCYGRTDLDLGPCFAAEAARLADALPPVTQVVTSPLSRCHRLAQAIATARALPLRIDPRLIEMDFGRWEGVAWDAIPRAEIDAWAADLLHARPHGGETVAEMATRAAAALADLARGPSPVLAVTHAGILKAVHATRDGPEAWHRPFPFASWQVIDGP
ncbi:histidine phosphatase family protein [Rhodobaculum claviforme]|uniref:histidine phosphatase family protein n=1 Tax=Rhodobaculum claviforme TaxID=1549854 RepID=UPI0019139304